MYRGSPHEGSEASASGTAPRAVRTIGAGRALGLLLTVAGGLGWLASFQLIVDDWKLLQDPSYVPACNISPVIGCGDVMRTWQANLLGFPNMVLGLSAFAVVAAVGAALLAGTRFRRWVWLAVNAGALLGVVFVHWLAYQSLYALGKLCPYCMVIWAVTIAVFWYVTLHNLKEGVLDGRGRARRSVETVLEMHWILLLSWYAVIAILILTRFWPYWSTLW